MQVAGDSPYCASSAGVLSRESRADKDPPVIKHGPRPTPFGYPKRGGDSAPVSAVHGERVLVTHRGVMMTALFSRRAATIGERPCGHCGSDPHGSAGKRTRRLCRAANARTLKATTCTYCSTDAYVRGIRARQTRLLRCDGCDAMWAFRAQSEQPPSVDSRVISVLCRQNPLIAPWPVPMAAFRRGIAWRPNIFLAPLLPPRPAARRDQCHRREQRAPTSTTPLPPRGARSHADLIDRMFGVARESVTNPSIRRSNWSGSRCWRASPTRCF